MAGSQDFKAQKRGQIVSALVTLNEVLSGNHKTVTSSFLQEINALLIEKQKKIINTISTLQHNDEAKQIVDSNRNALKEISGHLENKTECKKYESKVLGQLTLEKNPTNPTHISVSSALQYDFVTILDKVYTTDTNNTCITPDGKPGLTGAIRYFLGEKLLSDYFNGKKSDQALEFHMQRIRDLQLAIGLINTIEKNLQILNDEANDLQAKSRVDEYLKKLSTHFTTFHLDDLSVTQRFWYGTTSFQKFGYAIGAICGLAIIGLAIATGIGAIPLMIVGISAAWNVGIAGIAAALGALVIGLTVKNAYDATIGNGFQPSPGGAEPDSSLSGDSPRLSDSDTSRTQSTSSVFESLRNSKGSEDPKDPKDPIYHTVSDPSDDFSRRITSVNKTGSSRDVRDASPEEDTGEGVGFNYSYNK